MWKRGKRSRSNSTTRGPRAASAIAAAQPAGPPPATAGGAPGAVASLARSVKAEKDANSPFITGPLQIGEYDALLVAPATANTVAKIVYGIEDTMLTNAVGQTAKSDTPIFIMPVDLREGVTVTTRPGGEKLELRIRRIDVENSDKLRGMEGITVFESPDEIEGIIQDLERRRAAQ